MNIYSLQNNILKTIYENSCVIEYANNIKRAVV